MGIIVQKFGGSSVATTEKLFNVCNHISKEYEKGNKVVVVVSAQGKTTDKLVNEEAEITENPNKREHDVLVSTGEQITISKLVMCLNELGYDAISYTGWQVPIVTDENHCNARIKYINTDKIIDKLQLGKIVIIAGFQGVSEQGEITTLGRGGSDTTAVALASALKSERCDIFTDVDGVYSSDPRVVDDVVKIKSISYDEMLELASLGAKVLHNRCVEIAKKYDTEINVKSSFKEKSLGTTIKKPRDMEGLTISGITKDDNISRVTIIGKENKVGRLYKVFKILSENNITVDTIAQSLGEHMIKDISFTVKKTDLNTTIKILNENLEELNAEKILHYENLSKVSVVGTGIVNNPKISATIFEVLYENNINMHMISTSEIKISVILNKNQSEIALKAIHEKLLK